MKPLIIISGLSGAGVSSAGRLLEDLGWRVISGLPAQQMAELVAAPSDQEGLAVLADLRVGNPAAALAGLKQVLAGRPYRLFFLDADEATLISRYKESRRPHPLQSSAGSLPAALAAERQLLAPLRAEPEVILLDTSHLTPTGLGEALAGTLQAERASSGLTVISFSYRHGLPLEADMVYDARALPNPHWRIELRELDGRDAAVAAYALESNPEALEYTAAVLRSAQELSRALLVGDRAEVIIAVGCTGGRHRSVALAERLAAHLRTELSRPVGLEHRALERADPRAPLSRLASGLKGALRPGHRGA